MDLKDAGRSPMAFVNKPKSSVTTPTRKSFIARLAEESAKPEEPPQTDDEPPVVVHDNDDDNDNNIEEEDFTIGRISPIRIEREDLNVPSIAIEEEIPYIPSPPRDAPRVPNVIHNDDPVETITREHLSPIKQTYVDVDDEDEIQERVADLINDPNKIDYNLEPEEVRNACIETFKSKFHNLKLNYPEQDIVYPEGKSLNKIHDTYHSIIKSIYVNMNLGQIQLGYIIVLMAIEFACVKAFNIPIAGFTKMELKRMYRYNQLMVELGEAFYSTGGSKWPLEWRVAGTLVMNVVIFVALKFLSQYVGGESMTEVIRNAVDKVLDNPVTKDNIESGTANTTGTKTADGLSSMMEGMMGGGGGGIAELIASFGTGFTQKMEKTAKAASTKKKRRFVFED